jgi:hypothetical protein
VTEQVPDQPAQQPPQTRWDRFLHWADRFYQSGEFDEAEREYKIEIASRIRDAREAMFNDDPNWVDKLNHAVTAKPNNLTNWRATQPFIAWCRSEPENAALAFRFLWNGDATVVERFDRFGEIVATSGTKTLIAETSFFHMAMDPEMYPMFRSTPVDRAMEFTGYPSFKDAGIKSNELGRRYDYFLRFLDNLMKRASSNGIEFRDRLDAQSAMWMVTQWEPINSWSESDRQAFLAYQEAAKLR